MLSSGTVMLQPVKDGVTVTQALSPHLTQHIVEFLASLPGLDENAAQRAWVYSAGLDAALQQQIQFDKPSSQFFHLLVQTAVRYGTLTDGRLAIEAVLHAAKRLVGPDRQKQCDTLIQQVQAEYQNSTL